jgi:hypothetical protein
VKRGVRHEDRGVRRRVRILGFFRLKSRRAGQVFGVLKFLNPQPAPHIFKKLGPITANFNQKTDLNEVGWVWASFSHPLLRTRL